ncbi:MAG: diguanylate cyclase domain-containing protein, partial [Gammaproteobacteria bacterium]
RTVFEDRLAQEVSRAQRSGASSAVVVVEVHGLTQINDTVGHTVGDEVLLEAARRTCAQFRASDTVARLGGNEFGV